MAVTGTQKKWGTAAAVIIAGVFLTLAALSVLTGEISPLILWSYLLINLITFFVYAVDKTAAKDGARRTQRVRCILGGWPGALIAQQTMRHKSKKQRFRIVFWMTVTVTVIVIVNVNVVMFAWLFTPIGAGAVQSWIGEGRLLVGTGSRATIEWVEPRCGRYIYS